MAKTAGLKQHYVRLLYPPLTHPRTQYTATPLVNSTLNHNMSCPCPEALWSWTTMGCSTAAVSNSLPLSPFFSSSSSSSSVSGECKHPEGGQISSAPAADMEPGLHWPGLSESPRVTGVWIVIVQRFVEGFVLFWRFFPAPHQHADISRCLPYMSNHGIQTIKIMFSL